MSSPERTATAAEAAAGPSAAGAETDRAARRGAIIPPRIVRGQTLAICAPAGPVKPERLKRGLERLGEMFRIRLAPGLTGERAADVPSYLAASDEQRAAELSALIADPDVRAIVLARGGYGLMRILDRIDPEILRRDPKPIVGFSDATALLSWAYVAAGVRGIHGPMIVQLGDLPDAHVAHLIALLTEPRAPGVRPWQLGTSGQGTFEGPLFAGNLTLISLLVGTPWELPLDGVLAVIEEVGEKPYELDRYLTQLALTGQLAKLRAVIIGELTRCVDANPPTGVPDPEGFALATIRERLGPIPHAWGAPIGHGSVNEAVPFGARAILDLERGIVDITEAAVA